MAAAPSNVYASAALYGRGSTVLALLQDVRQFLSPAAVVVHLSVGSSEARNALENTLSGGGDGMEILLNHESLRVRNTGPSILTVHLRNYLLLERHLGDKSRDATNDKVVLICANQRFFRPCRQHVLRHELSFSLGQTVDLRPSQHHPTVRYPSKEWDALAVRVNAKDDAFIQNNGYHKAFVHFMHNASAHGDIPTVRRHAPDARLQWTYVLCATPRLSYCPAGGRRGMEAETVDVHASRGQLLSHLAPPRVRFAPSQREQSL